MTVIERVSATNIFLYVRPTLYYTVISCAIQLEYVILRSDVYAFLSLIRSDFSVEILKLPCGQRKAKIISIANQLFHPKNDGRRNVYVSMKSQTFGIWISFSVRYWTPYHIRFFINSKFILKSDNSKRMLLVVETLFSIFGNTWALHWKPNLIYSEQEFSLRLCSNNNEPLQYWAVEIII